MQTPADAQQGSLMDISHYFKLMAEKDASDMFLSTGAPVNIKIEGMLQPMSDSPLTASTPP